MQGIRSMKLSRDDKDEYVKIAVTVSNPMDLRLRERVNFIVDTGAMGCTLPREVAERLKLEDRGEVDAVMADGRVTTAKVAFALLEIGGKRLYTWVAYGPGFDALLGLDVMRILKVHVDVPAKDILTPLKHLKIGRLTVSFALRRGEGGRSRMAGEDAHPHDH
jgi:predicted aspartyl protease